jgi:hypothetical protein
VLAIPFVSVSLPSPYPPPRVPHALVVLVVPSIHFLGDVPVPGVFVIFLGILFPRVPVLCVFACPVLGVHFLGVHLPVGVDPL